MINYYMNFKDTFGHYDGMEFEVEDDSLEALATALVNIAQQKKIVSVDEIFETEPEDPYAAYRICEEEL